MGAWEAPGKTDEWYTPPEVFSALLEENNPAGHDGTHDHIPEA